MYKLDEAWRLKADQGAIEVSYKTTVSAWVIYILTLISLISLKEII